MNKLFYTKILFPLLVSMVINIGCNKESANIDQIKIQEDNKEINLLHSLILKNEHVIKNPYYLEKIKSKTKPDFMKTIQTEEGHHYHFFAFYGGSHQGILIMINENANTANVWNDCGPISNVLDSSYWPFLQSNEILIIDSTGGSGSHHVYGILFSIKLNKAKYSFPLQGRQFQVPSSLYVYKIKTLEQKNNQLYLKGSIERTELNDNSEPPAFGEKSNTKKFISFTYSINNVYAESPKSTFTADKTNHVVASEIMGIDWHINTMNNLWNGYSLISG
jgi:hypothetical protein